MESGTSVLVENDSSSDNILKIVSSTMLTYTCCVNNSKMKYVISEKYFELSSTNAKG